MTTQLPSEHFRDVARAMLRHAYEEYLRWQPDGDWDTFLSWVDEEGGQKRRSVRMRPGKRCAQREGRQSR